MDANDTVFSNTYDLKSFTKEPTCYKNPNRPSYIDLILTNKSRSFPHSRIIETDLPGLPLWRHFETSWETSTERSEL